MNTPSEGTPAAKKNTFWQILAVAALLLAVVGGLFGFMSANPKMAKMFVPEEKINSLTLPSLTVNLADHGYVKTTITVEYVASKKLNKEVEHSTYAFKDSVIKVLRNTSYADLQKPQATENLKKALQEEINSTLSKGKISRLYFEEFLTQ